MLAAVCTRVSRAGEGVGELLDDEPGRVDFASGLDGMSDVPLAKRLCAIDAARLLLLCLLLCSA